MPSKRLFPSREAEFENWSKSLAEKVFADPAAYGQTVDEAAGYEALQGEFATAYAVANDPDTRTRPNISVKNTKKGLLLVATRALVSELQSWPGMTDAKRDALQIPVRDRTPTPILPPDEAPKVSVVAVTGRVIELQLMRQDNRKARPPGTAAAWIYRYIGEEEPVSLKAFTVCGASPNTRPRIVMPEDTPAGTKVWLTAAWINPRQQLGPACPPFSITTNTLEMTSAA